MKKRKQKTLIWTNVQHRNPQTNYCCSAKMAPQKVDKLVTLYIYIYVCWLPGAYLNPAFSLESCETSENMCGMKKRARKWHRRKRTPMRFTYAPAK